MPENKASAVASWLGYVTQEYRLVQRLLKADKKSILGFELLDDVEEKSDKGRIVEQDKVSVTTRNILANQSKALWNTLSNWINLIKEDKVDSSETTFVLFTNKEHTSEVLKLLVKASNKSEAQEAYNEIIKYVHSPSDNIKQYVDNFLVMDGNRLINPRIKQS
jgi:glycyl-tRNA synthetase beta subunit